MAISEEFTAHPQKSDGALPLPATALYWQIFEMVDHYLKTRTMIDTRYHGPASKFIAGLYLFFYENEYMEAGEDLTSLPFEATALPLSQLGTINRWVDQDMRLLISKDQTSDQSIKILSIMRMGQISQKIKKIIMRHQMAWLAPLNAVNDNG